MCKIFNFDSVSGIKVFKKVKERVSFSLDRVAPTNPSSRHLLGQETASIIDSCTKDLTESIGKGFSNGVWTSSATECHHLIANSIKPKKIIVPRGSRLSLVNAAKILSIKYGSQFITPKFNQSNGFDFSVFENLNEDDVLFVEASSSELGFVHDLEKLSSAVKKSGVKVLIDISSSAGWLEIKNKVNFANWVSLSFFRFGGPSGVGFVALKNNDLKPIFSGVEQEGLRGGCLPLSLIEGASITFSVFKQEFESSIKNDWNEAISKLRFFLNNHLKVNEFLFEKHLPHVLSSWANNIDLDAFRMNLSLEGIHIGTGPACISGAGKKSETLEDLNIPTRESLLISPDLDLKIEDLEYLYEKFEKAWKNAKII